MRKERQIIIAIGTLILILIILFFSQNQISFSPEEAFEVTRNISTPELNNISKVNITITVKKQLDKLIFAETISGSFSANNIYPAEESLLINGTEGVIFWQIEDLSPGKYAFGYDLIPKSNLIIEGKIGGNAEEQEYELVLPNKVITVQPEEAPATPTVVPAGGNNPGGGGTRGGSTPTQPQNNSETSTSEENLNQENLEAENEDEIDSNAQQEQNQEKTTPKKIIYYLIMGIILILILILIIVFIKIKKENKIIQEAK
jgi:uncharacterized integral membrane protein